jgi:hypothetical protein
MTVPEEVLVEVRVPVLLSIATAAMILGRSPRRSAGASTRGRCRRSSSTAA